MKREPARIPVKDPDTEKAIDEVRRPVVELCRDRFLNGRDLEVTLPPNVPTTVKTGLDYPFTNYTLSPPRGGGGPFFIFEVSRTDTSVTLECQAAGPDLIVGMRVW